MPEQLFHEDKDIRRFSVEQPVLRESVTFDPHQDLTDADWQLAVDWLPAARARGFEDYLSWCVNLRVLDPERFMRRELTGLELSDLRRDIIQSLEGSYDLVDGMNVMHVTRIAVAMKMSGQLSLITHALSRNSLEHLLKRDMSRVTTASLKMLYAAYLQILFPNSSESEAHYSLLLTELNQYIKEDAVARIAESACQLRLAFPDRWDPMILKDSWKNLRAYFRDCQARRTENLVVVASDLTILAAEQIYVDSQQGLVVVPAKGQPNDSHQPNPIPETRRY